MMIVEAVYETVYVIEDWYDGPRSGFADYRQQPHFYRSLHLDEDNYNQYNYNEDRFELAPVSAQVVEWAVEDNHLWQSWDTAYRAGILPEDVNDDERILPEDRVRHKELRDLIEYHIKAQVGAPFVVRGKFEPDFNRVRWQEKET